MMSPVQDGHDRMLDILASFLLICRLSLLLSAVTTFGSPSCLHSHILDAHIWTLKNYVCVCLIFCSLVLRRAAY